MKRTVLILLILCLSCSPVFAINWTQDANCSFAWLFTEGSGTTVDDASSNNNDGTFKADGEPAWSSIAGTNAPSYASYMVQFDDSDDYIQKLSATNLPSDDITITIWLRSDNFGGNTSSPVDLYDADSSPEFLTYFNNGLDCFFWTPSSNRATADTVTDDLTQDNWVFFAFVGDESTSSNNKIYVNGVDRTDSTSDYATQSNLDSIRVGNREGGGWALEDYVSETGAFSKVLDSTDINDIMDNGLVQAAAGRTRRFF